jgi:hypothetical protein
VDFAQINKVYRAIPEGERKYSSGEVVRTVVVPILAAFAPRSSNARISP